MGYYICRRGKQLRLWVWRVSVEVEGVAATLIVIGAYTLYYRLMPSRMSRSNRGQVERGGRRYRGQERVVGGNTPTKIDCRKYLMDRCLHGLMRVSSA